GVVATPRPRRATSAQCDLEVAPPFDEELRPAEIARGEVAEVAAARFEAQRVSGGVQPYGDQVVERNAGVADVVEDADDRIAHAATRLLGPDTQSEGTLGAGGVPAEREHVGAGFGRELEAHAGR